MMMFKKNLLIPIGLLFFITGCSNVKNLEITPENNIINKESALQIRDIQVRTFENTTKENLVTAVVDTLLDDDYFITTIDVNAGLISAISNKNNLTLNLVSTIKETKDGSYLVRFSISAADKSVAFKSYIIITDDTIYRYLFDRLRKSLFLDKELYNVPQDSPVKEQKTIIQKEITVIQKEEVSKPVSKVISHKCESSKCQDNSSLIYSVQFLCTADKNVAQKEFDKLKASNPDVRMHPYYEYQVIRLGRFKTRLEAEVLMNRFKDNYPEISVVAFKPKR
jgi:hypothetical protein